MLYTVHIIVFIIFVLDIANNFAGSLMGIINAMGNTMGFIAPKVTGIRNIAVFSTSQ